MYRIKKAEIRNYLWQGDRPLLTFILPGFDCGSTEILHVDSVGVLQRWSETSPLIINQPGVINPLPS